MSLDNPSAGYNSVGSYQLAGIPWVTSSIVSGIRRFDFNLVSKSITVRNVSGSSDIKVAFTQNGLTSNYFQLASGEGYSDELRMTMVFVSGSGNIVTVIAGLTPVPARNALVLTASSGFEGIG